MKKTRRNTARDPLGKIQPSNVEAGLNYIERTPSPKHSNSKETSDLPTETVSIHDESDTSDSELPVIIWSSIPADKPPGLENADKQKLTSCTKNGNGTSGALESDEDEELSADDQIMEDYYGKASKYRDRHNLQNCAAVPDWIPGQKHSYQPGSDKTLLLWASPQELPKDKLEHYMKRAKYDDYTQYTIEQAMGFLHYHNYDTETAEKELSNYTPEREKWTREETNLFVQSCEIYGADMNKIKMFFPDKTIGALVRHHYRSKRVQKELSSMDVDDHVKSSHCLHFDESPVGGQVSSKGSSSSGDKTPQNISGRKTYHCGNCRISCSILHGEGLCNTCFMYWKMTNDHRPLTPCKPVPFQLTLEILRKRSIPPRGINVNHEDLCAVVSASTSDQQDSLSLEVIRTELQNEKQELEFLKRKLPPGDLVIPTKLAKADHTGSDKFLPTVHAKDVEVRVQMDSGLQTLQSQTQSGLMVTKAVSGSPAWKYIEEIEPKDSDSAMRTLNK